jgi:hypothetical protein
MRWIVSPRFRLDRRAPHARHGPDQALRDARVPRRFFRGLTVWWIFADPTRRDGLSGHRLRNFAMRDATEVFALLAAYGAGLCYGVAPGRDFCTFTASI